MNKESKKKKSPKTIFFIALKNGRDEWRGVNKNKMAILNTEEKSSQFRWWVRELSQKTYVIDIFLKKGRFKNQEPINYKQKCWRKSD